MNLAAIHHEGTQRWCHAIAPGRFLFRIQVGRDDMRHVYLHTRDKHIPLKYFDSRRITEMKKVACDGLHDYYEAELEFHVACLRYCFRFEGADGSVVHLISDGFSDSIPEDKERLFDCTQNLREEELFTVPQWAKNRVIYQIFPARFAADQPVNQKLWYQAPIGAGTQLGGNLRGILSRLDHIRELGADVIYMTPIFYSKSTHKYDTIDYYRVDPTFGTEADLIGLVQKAHAMGLRVILDGVFNHTSPDFFAFSDLKQNRENSPYRDWYYPEGFPIRTFPKPNYKCFGYFGGMPKVNLGNPDAARYFTDVALYWLRTAGIDGWRLDVADEISHSFWQSFRREVKAEFPDALIVGEIWHHAPDFMQGDQWDSLMNYPFFRAVEDFAASGSCSASSFLGRLGHIRGNTHTNAYPILWNLIGSHDTARLLHRCGEDRSRHRLAAAIQLLWPGMPMLYYGDEVAMTGGPDPDCRRGMLWEEARQDRQMLAWYRNLIRIRNAYPVFTEGSILSETADDALGLVRIHRRYQNTEAVLVFHNQPGRAVLPELAGQTDLLTGTVFSGTVEGICALAFLN